MTLAKPSDLKLMTKRNDLKYWLNIMVKPNDLK